MLIKNGVVLTEIGNFETQDIYTKDILITENEADGDIIDAKGCYVLPGLIDLHFHGCNGYDFCDGTLEAIQALAEYEAKNGITSICPATMTLGDEALEEIFRAGASYQENPSEIGADLVGINMEGPYVSDAKKGAQNGLYLHLPDISHFQHMNECANHLIRLVTLAPELEGSMEFIEALSKQVAISVGHTCADFDIAKEAFEKGASHITHLYNAMNPYTHRNPGVLGAACDCPWVTAELICDGIHLHPSTIRTTFKAFGDDRIVLVSDSMMATGLSDGEYSLGGQAVTVKGATATLASGTIAGSATNLFQCVKKVVSFGIPLAAAVKCASVNPAKKLGIYEYYGSLTPGKYANILIVGEDLELKHVVLRGKLLF